MTSKPDCALDALKTIAFYLPQYHPIPENNEWWGTGFTEWTNVAKAKPNFTSHYQPQLPADLGFYDLRVPEILEEQVALAKKYGLNGFCFYYYWFAGKRLLYAPIESYLKRKELDFPYCLCWANEDWTRAWDGKSNEVLIKQNHSEKDHKEFIRKLIPHFKDERYIKIDNRPVLLVYRIDLIPDARTAVNIWKTECALSGIEDPYLIAVQSFHTLDPVYYDFDAALEFPPLGVNTLENCNNKYKKTITNKNFSGYIIDAEKYVEKVLSRGKENYPLFRTVFPSWDNTARRQDSSLIFVNTSPSLYQSWLEKILNYTLEEFSGDERLVFINAWNEWAEGCHLEPDSKYKYSYLEATLNAKKNVIQQSCSLNDEEKLINSVSPDEKGEEDKKDEKCIVNSQESDSGIMRLSKKFIDSVKPRLSRAARFVFRKLPVSQSIKFKLAYFVYHRLPFIFKLIGQDKASLINIEFKQFHVIKASKIRRVAKDYIASISLSTSDRPVVSIIIPVYGKVEHTLHCLNSISVNKPLVPYEIIVIDDCSNDSSFDTLNRVSGIRLVRNEENLGYLLSCNKASLLAKGEYIHFLNNDTEVIPGWLDALYETLSENSEVGLAGSMLIFPGGELQEAGGRVFRDGSAENIGRNSNIYLPEFNYSKAVDYCSGASMMISRKLFMSLGQFDENFKPAYYEDTDLAFKVRNGGYKVLYQPSSKVIHFEGVSNGKSLSKGIKRYQVVNQEKFHKKWKDILESFPESSLTVSEGQSRKALVIDWMTPTPDRDSGSIDTYNYLLMFRKMGFEVTFCPKDLLHYDKYTEDLQRHGIQCLYQPFVKSLRSYLRSYGHSFDVVFLQRAHCAILDIQTIKKHCPNAKVIFNTVDLHFFREQREAQIKNNPDLLKSSQKTKEIEHKVMSLSDVTITISESERKVVEDEFPEVIVRNIPFIREVVNTSTPYDQRKDIVFIGGFLFSPNVDAVKFFVQEIWPKVHARLPDVNFLIIGSNLPEDIERLGAVDGVVPLGYIENLDEVFGKCRLSVAPLRYGAGTKGKVATSLTSGVPCVATDIAAEGLNLEDRKNILLANTPEQFAENIIELYCDPDLWNSISENGLIHFKETYSFNSVFNKVKRIIEDDLGIKLN